jgi:hypothetical protein
MSAFARQLQFERLMWFAAFFVGLVVVSMILTTGNYMVILLVGGLAWLALLPYHAKLALGLGVTNFGSALILPFFPGRPAIWEFAALLAWSGLVVTFCLREQAPDFGQQMRRNRVALLGLAGYVGVLLMLIGIQGTGLNVLGSEQTGGRVYYQQIVCAIFPILFLAIPLTSAQLIRLYTWQCFLSLTYIISDLALATGVGGKLWVLLYFFGISNDGLAFEGSALAGGVRRFQSLAIVGQALIYLLLSRFSLSRFFTRSAFWLLPLSMGLLVLGSAAGHRGMLVLLAMTLLGCIYGQRFMTVPRVLISLVLLALLLFATYTNARQFPLSVQRTLSLLPGIEVDSLAAEDGQATFNGRLVMRRVAWEIAPHYLWIGRGFGFNPNVVPPPEYDPYGFIREYIELGHFYNGFVGLLVNAGIPGLVFCYVFLLAMSARALKVLRHLRRHGCNDNLSRLTCVLASNWLAKVVFFTFLHGDAQFTLLEFGLPAGLLLGCSRHLLDQRESAPSEAVQLENAPAV